MIFTHHKGKHRARPLYWWCWWPLLFNPVTIARRVTFDFTARYDHPGTYDDEDVNKLFGVAFLRPHRNSARFGWRYDPAAKKIILYAYCYANGKREIGDLCTVVANHFYDCVIKIHRAGYDFIVYNENGEEIAFEYYERANANKLGWLLGPYFGGNRPAPHEITIKMRKL